MLPNLLRNHVFEAGLKLVKLVEGGLELSLSAGKVVGKLFVLLLELLCWCMLQGVYINTYIQSC